MSESILSRQKTLSLSSEISPFSISNGDRLSSIQSLVDDLVTRFVDEAADLKTLAALTAGGLAYRFGRVGTMALGNGHVAAMPLRFLSIGFGLGTEVGAFEFTNRFLPTVWATGQSPLQAQNSNLWSWNGAGGWKQSLINDVVTFGMLKGAGYLSRESNVVFQHAFSSTAMVAGHNAVEYFGILPCRGAQQCAPTLAEQFLHAEITNLQLGAGTSLVHSMAPGISALERGLDLSLQTQSRATGQSPLQMGPRFVLAVGASAIDSMADARHAEKNPYILQMAGTGDPPSGERTDPTPSTLPSGVTPEQNVPLLTLASELGVEVLSYRPGQNLTQIQIQARAKVMDLISQPELASRLLPETLHPLRLFVVGGGGDPVEVARAVHELMEIVRERNRLSPAIPEPSQALARIPPEAPPARDAREGTLQGRQVQVLMLKELPELFQNPRIVTHHPDGRMQISLRGKRNLSLQDYFEFYQLIFRQAGEFREMLQHLQGYGIDILPLAPRVEQMDGELRQAARHIKEGRGDEARPYLEEVDRQIEGFQRDLIAIAAQRGWGAPHFGGRLALYGQNVLPAGFEPRLDNPGPEAAPALRPASRKIAIPSPQALNVGPQEDYMVFIDRRDWMVDFSKHPIYYLYQGERNVNIAYDDGYRVESKPLPPPAQFLGTFKRSVEGFAFEYASGLKTQKTRFNPHQPTSEDSQSGSLRRRFHHDVKIVPLAEPLTEYLAKSILSKEGRLEDPLNLLLTHLLKVEESVREKEAHDIRVAQYQWTQMGVLFNEKSPFEEAVIDARKEDVSKIVSEAVFFLAHPWGSLKSRARELLAALLPKISHKDQQDLMPILIASYFSRPDEATPFAKSHETLRKILNPLSIDARKSALKLIAAQVAKGPEIAQGDLDFLENLLGGFPLEVLEKMVTPSDPKELQRLIKAYGGGLPMVKPLYEQYLLSSDPDHFVAYAVERIGYFRQGGFLISKDPHYLAMAYGSLDNPEQLSYDQFAREVILEDLPRPFMNEPFRVEVPLVKVAHAKVDKGIVKEAYAAVAKVHRTDLLVEYLREVLAKPKQNGLSPFRGELPTEEVNQENVIDLSKKLLKALAQGKKNLTPQAREVITNLTFGIAAQSENGQALLPTLALYHEKMSSDQLLQVLNALREFYGDAVGEVLKEHELKLKPIEQMGERLKKQVDQVKTEAGAVQVIDLVPSKSQTDVFAGYIGEDCTKSRWKEAIKRTDTQVYRMLSNKRLVGMLYLKRHLFDDEVTLILGIEPRARFRVNSEALLDGVLKNLGEIAGKGDYDYILISNNGHERSNRPDMNDAIVKRFEGRPPSIFGQKVDGGIFSSQILHVAWERPPNLTKGDPPSDSIGDVVSMKAQTVIGALFPREDPPPGTPQDRLRWWQRGRR